jgi:hypothetical protein
VSETELAKFVNKKVAITFESKKYGKTFDYSGRLLSASHNRAVFVDGISDYPEHREAYKKGIASNHSDTAYWGVFDYVNITRIRTIKEIANEND